MEIVAQTDSLVISKNFDVLLTRFLTVSFDESIKQFIYQIGMDLVNCEVYDTLGLIPSSRKGDIITIDLRRITVKNQKINLKFKILLQPSWEQIGDIYHISWLAKDLFEIKLSDPVFYRISGFAKVGVNPQNNRIVIASKNLSAKFTDHISKNRGIIIAMSKKQKPKYYTSVNLTFKNDQPIGEISNLKIVTPQSDRYKVVKLHKITGTSQIPQIEKDDQGNYYLQFDTITTQEKTLEIEVVSEISLTHLVVPYDYTDLGTMQMLSQAVSRSKGGVYFTSNVEGAFELYHPTIQKYAQAAKQKNSVFDAHRLLFELANRELEYQISSGRRSSTWAIENKIGDCSEFSYLLVALHRAAGIPSRIVEGSVIDGDRLQGHGWVEFLSPTLGWIQCDPTWGLPLGTSPLHIRFVNHSSGSSPNYISFKSGHGVKLDWEFRLLD